MPVRINMLGLLCLLVVASSAAVGQHPYRPVPSQQQTYHKPHDWAPGVSVVTPSFDYLPANPEAVCSECRERPILDAVDHWSERWAPWVVGPALLDKAEAKLGLQDARYHAYGGAEFILWNTNSPSVAPLITTSPAGTPQAQAGVLGQPGTSTLFGGGLYDDTRRLIAGRHHRASVL